MYINRHITAYIERMREQFRILLITSSRQGGKSTLLKKKFLPEYEYVIIERDNILYPIEIKKTAHPTLDMARHFSVLSKISERTVGQGCILCQCDKMLYLHEDVVSVPVDFL